MGIQPLKRSGEERGCIAAVSAFLQAGSLTPTQPPESPEVLHEAGHAQDGMRIP